MVLNRTLNLYFLLFNKISISFLKNCIYSTIAAMASSHGTTDKIMQLKCKQKTVQATITRFSAEIHNLKDDFTIEDVEHIVNHLMTVLKEIKITDNEIHNFIS